MKNWQGIEVLGGQDQDEDAGRQPLVMPIPVQHLEHQSELQELKERAVEQITRMDKLIEQETRREKLKEQTSMKEK
ncbi:hypothetical protein K1719_012696 [Acacia pycnantha]|nr:hypothetical protein K1719_012696 [Acacia pycnantha]